MATNETTTGTSPWGRGNWLLVALGLSLLGIFLVLLRLSAEESFQHGNRSLERPLRTMTFLLVLAGTVYFVVAILAIRRAPPLRWVILFAILFRAALLPSGPMQEDDIYRYLWDGKVVADGGDPYLMSPKEVLEYPAVQPQGPGAESRRRALRRLAGLRDRHEASGEILARVNNYETPTIYPPLLQGVFALHARYVPQDWTVAQQIVAMKGLLALFDIGIIVLLPFLLRLAGLAPGLLVIYAWCPLILKECSNSGHVDAVPAFFVIAALASVLAVSCARGAAGAIGWALGAGIALGLAVSAKIYPLLLIPLVWRRLGLLRGGVAVFACVNVLVAQAVLFFPGAEKRLDVVKLFALQWENHCALFSALRHVVGLFVEEGTKSFPVGKVVLAVDIQGFCTRIVVGCIVIVATIWNAWKVDSRIDARAFLERCFLVAAILFLVGPIGFPWYFVWCVPLLPFVRRRAWLLLPGILMTYYVGFWFEYRYDDAYSTWWSIFDPIVLVEFLLFFAVLASEGITEVVKEKPWRE